MTTAPTAGRNSRRKEQTRAALVHAAQELLVNGRGQEASIKEITELADVGFGSFFNHFDNKADLFDAALTQVASRYEEWLDLRLKGVNDPLQRLCLSIRHTGRLHLEHPDDAKLLIGQITFLHAGKPALSDRVRTDVVDAVTFLHPNTPGSPSVVIAATGAIAAVLGAAATLPEDDRAQLADSLVADVLRMIGAGETRIAELVAEPLPRDLG
jgi:AcrR family transcriptional regulator